jgi:glucose-6-phosphate isomerase
VDRLRIDYSNMFASRLGGRGLDAAVVDESAAAFDRAHAQLVHGRDDGTFGFLELPAATTVVEQIRTFAEGIGQAFDTIVVLGIGGSALGTIMLQHALLKPHWNELDDEAREYFPRLYVLDNVDPTTIEPLLARLDLRRTLFNVVSKSGATAETMAQFLIVSERLRAIFDEEGYRRHLIFTTDPEKGVLRRIADAEGIATLPVPANVGGRFSVLSAVGLLPAALVGVDIAELLAGAAAMTERCATAELRRNPAGIFAVLQHAAHARAGAPMHVMLPYSDRLYPAADWFRQLWAESLGKRVDRSGREVFRGPTPIKALGATDQHSQVQLYMEGPFDKTVTLLHARDRAVDLPVPRVYGDVDELGYLGGSTLGELLDAERVATTAALTAAGRMNMTIELPRLDAHAFGEFVMMLQIATVYAGALYDVDPLDQPGVELGKQLTYGLMGRRGFEPPPADAGESDRAVVA